MTHQVPRLLAVTVLFEHFLSCFVKHGTSTLFVSSFEVARRLHRQQRNWDLSTQLEFFGYSNPYKLSNVQLMMESGSKVSGRSGPNESVDKDEAVDKDGSCSPLPKYSAVFHEASSTDSKSLTDGVRLSNQYHSVILPWLGYGTYKLGRQNTRKCTKLAFEVGYRCIDTAFVYGGETTEIEVGHAIKDAIQDDQNVPKIRSRQDIVVISKHWRAYHGYDKTMECLQLSLKRLQLEYIDIWLMHWPGPSWDSSKKKRKQKNDNDDPTQDDLWESAEGVQTQADMPRLRSETWRAMEDAVRLGLVKVIGVSNFSVEHLQK